MSPSDLERLVATFTDLARIDSPSRQEGRLASLVADTLGGYGWQVRDDGTGPGCGNLIASLPGTTATATAPVLLTSHLDVVPPCLGVQPRIEDGVVRSSGETVLGADAKASVAVLLELARLLRGRLADLARPPVELLFTWGEEIGHLGARAVHLDQLQARRAWVLDGLVPVGTIIVAAPTYWSFSVQIVGRAAHAGVEPERGVSAIQVAADAIARLRWGRLDAETTANVGTIQGGGVRNAVAAETRVEGEVRSLAPSRAEDVARTIGETFQSVAAAAGASASVELTEQYVGYTLGADEPVVRLASQAFAALGTGRASELVPSGGGSDANELNARGVRACVLGIGATNCHSTAESIGVAQLQLLARWVQEILRLAARG